MKNFLFQTGTWIVDTTGMRGPGRSFVKAADLANKCPVYVGGPPGDNTALLYEMPYRFCMTTEKDDDCALAFKLALFHFHGIADAKGVHHAQLARHGELSRDMLEEKEDA